MERHNLLILGNGFDIDLGLETKYSNFAQSEYWPDLSQHSSSTLARVLEKEKSSNLDWFNLEDIMADYIQQLIDFSKGIRGYKFVYGKADEEVLNIVSNSLMQYIKHAEQNSIKTASRAALLLKAVLQNSLFDKIYSFNYTDITSIAHRLGLVIPKTMECVNIHGKADDNAIVLGISGGKQVPSGYKFLKKTHRPYYESSDFLTSLNNANCVIIFGHSFGTQDYSYFDSYLKRLSINRDNSLQELIVITKDSISANNIKDQLEDVGDIQDLTAILNNGSLRFIKTSEVSDENYRSFLDYVNRKGKTEYRFSIV